MIFEELALEEPFPVAREALVGVTAVERTGSTNTSNISLKHITDTTLKRLDPLWMSLTSLCQSTLSRTLAAMLFKYDTKRVVNTIRLTEKRRNLL